jgi:phosphoribosylglycinamide formyltransferase 1
LEKRIITGSTSVVISNNSKSEALKYARSKNIPAFHISETQLRAPFAKVATKAEQGFDGAIDKTDEAIRDTLVSHDVNLVILSGYMRRVGDITREAFLGRIINVHPSLLPQYAGLWGDAVHEAVLRDKQKKTGVTLHLINEEYDKGKILRQSEVTVMKNDTVYSLKKKVQKEEIKSFISLLTDIQSGKISL